MRNVTESSCYRDKFRVATMAKRAVNVEEAMEIEQNYNFWAIFLFFKMTCLKKVFNYRPCAKTVNVEEAQEVEQNYIFWAISSFFKMTCLDKVFNYRHINAANNCVMKFKVTWSARC